MRLTITRAVKGLLARVIQLARAVRRPVDCRAAGGGVMTASLGSSSVRKPGSTTVSRLGMRVTGATGPASLTTNFTAGNGFGRLASNCLSCACNFSHSALVASLRRSGSLDCSRSNCRDAISAICLSYAVRSSGRLRIITLILSMNFSNPSRVACLSSTGCSMACNCRRNVSVLRCHFWSASKNAVRSANVPTGMEARGSNGAKKACMR